jgi:AcrR family transcriptional regulator
VSTSESAPRYHHGDLRAALLRSALEILTEQGVAALTLREVARRAGVSAMAPYRHYTDKDALLAAVAEHGFRMLEQRLSDAPRSSPAEGLVVQGMAYVRFAMDEPALFRLMFGPFMRSFDAHPALKEAAHGARAALTRAVAAATPEADEATREDVALACWSLSHGLASLIVDGRLMDAAADPEAVAARLTEVLEAGVNNIGSKARGSAP